MREVQGNQAREGQTLQDVRLVRHQIGPSLCLGQQLRRPSQQHPLDTAYAPPRSWLTILLPHDLSRLLRSNRFSKIYYTVTNLEQIARLTDSLGRLPHSAGLLDCELCLLPTVAGLQGHDNC